jgi:hypothetical protein
MQAKALVRFCIGEITANEGTIIDFTNAREQMQMLLNMGWIEPIQESKAKGKQAK